MASMALFRWVANMHGNEAVGRQIVMFLAQVSPYERNSFEDIHDSILNECSSVPAGKLWERRPDYPVDKYNRHLVDALTES